MLKLHGDNKNLCSDWNIVFKWEIGGRGVITFKLDSYFNDCKENLFFYLLLHYADSFAVYNILLVILAVWEMLIVIQRLWRSYKNFHVVHSKFKNKTFEENNTFNYSGEDNNYLSINNVSRNCNSGYINLSEEDNLNNKFMNIKNLTKNNQWEMLSFSDKKKFFNMWIVLFLIGNIFQIFTGIINLIFPIFGENNMIMNSIGCMLAWFGTGYFLDFQNRYSFFYKIIKKNSFQYIKLIFIFGMIFLIFVILGITAFSHNYLFRTSSNAGIFFFSLIFSDTMFNNLQNIAQKNPYASILVAFLFFLCFNTLCLRIFTSITEDTFDAIKMKDNYSWLNKNKKFDLQEYLINELKHKNDDDDENDKLPLEDHHHMVSDVFIQVLLSREDELNEKINEFLIREENKLKTDLAFSGEMEFNIIAKKKLKKIKKVLISKNMLKNIIKYDAKNDPMQINLRLGKTDWKKKKLKYYYDYSELIFKCITQNFHRIGDIICTNKSIYMNNLTKKNCEDLISMVFLFTNRILERINVTTEKSKYIFRKMNPAGNLLLTLDY